jgi:hypothetical protein
MVHMAWEWVGTAVVGIAGIVGTFRTGEKSRRHAADQAQLGRTQDRQAVAYVELLNMVERVGQWVGLVFPLGGSEDLEPDLPDLPDQARASALLAAYGTDVSRALFWAWDEQVRKIMSTVQLIRLAKEQRETGVSVHDQYIKLDGTLRPAEKAAREALGRQVARELRGETTA